jgi:hypothetical protein
MLTEAFAHGREAAMRDRQSVALAPSPVVWPPDDTEESVLGTSLHQTTITNLRLGINEAASIATPDGSPLLWQAGGQTMIRNFRRPDDSDYTTLPDIFVYRRPWDDARGSLSVTVDGPPILIIEVVSDATAESNLDMERGKGYSYARAGVREYLILDPMYAELPVGGQGWRLVDGLYRPWLPDDRGRWASAELPLLFGLEGARAVVETSEGRRLLREGEIERTLRDRERQLELQERRHAETMAEQELLRRTELARREQAHLEELAQLRRRLEELERER